MTRRGERRSMLRDSYQVSLATGGNDPIDAFIPRDLHLPRHGSEPEHVYRAWFGNGRVPRPDYTIWFGCPPEVDDSIRAVFGGLWEEARAGGLTAWEDEPRACLAKLILIDQFPRHMFRGRPEAFALDEMARAVAERCVQHFEAGHEYHIEEALIMAWPWIHAETPEITARAVAWIDGLGERARGTPYHPRISMHRYGARLHEGAVRRFGRYPHRNPILGRTSTPEELRYLRHERPNWGTDQWARFRGGTHGYFVGQLGYVRSMFAAMLRQGDFAAVAGLSRAVRPEVLFARRKIVFGADLGSGTNLGICPPALAAS